MDGKSMFVHLAFFKWYGFPADPAYSGKSFGHHTAPTADGYDLHLIIPTLSRLQCPATSDAFLDFTSSGA
jgi:hypothetical protein